MTAPATQVLLAVAVKAERRRLSSQFADCSLMFPGESTLVWVRPAHFPWLLASIEPSPAGVAA